MAITPKNMLGTLIYHQLSKKSYKTWEDSQEKLIFFEPSIELWKYWKYLQVLTLNCYKKQLAERWADLK